jgi:hypothetical protein
MYAYFMGFFQQYGPFFCSLFPIPYSLALHTPARPIDLEFGEPRDFMDGAVVFLCHKPVL